MIPLRGWSDERVHSLFSEGYGYDDVAAMVIADPKRMRKAKQAEIRSAVLALWRRHHGLTSQARAA